MRWKIQTRSVNGWADLKTSDDGGPYYLETYASLDEARAEIATMEQFGKGCRAVPEDTPADDELYD